MQNQQMNKVKIDEAGTSKSRFPWQHDHNTTMTWGRVQPTINTRMIPGSSATVDTETLIRLAPMVVPTFGRVKMKNTAHLTKYSEIWENFPAFLSKTPVTRPSSNGTVTFTPNTIPNIPNDILASFQLTGAKGGLWVKRSNAKADGRYYNYGQSNSITSDDKIEVRNILRTVLEKIFGCTNNPTNLERWGYTGPTFRATMLTNSGNSNNNWATVPFNSWAYDSNTLTLNNQYFGHPNFMMLNQVPKEDLKTPEVIGIENADIIVKLSTAVPKEGRWNLLTDEEWGKLQRYVSELVFTFRLSNFGKAWRKLLLTSGYSLDLSDPTPKDIIPLMAYYKSYWDTYMPERTKNYYSSNQYKLIQETLNSNNNCNLGRFFDDTGDRANNMINLVKTWIFDLGNTFATDKMDVFSAATENPLVQSETLERFSSQLTPEVNNMVFTQDANYKADSPNMTGYPALIATSINTQITQQDLNILCKMYRYVNKMSQAGQNIKAILIANGLGKEVEESQTKFINSNEITIKISDVVSQSATTERPLGDWGGKGMGYGQSKFTVETDTFAVLTVLSVIVPESGYTNGADATLDAIKMEDLYNYEFDGLNVEAVTANQITAAPQMSEPGAVMAKTGRKTFGYLPTFSAWKMRTNKATGDFSLKSKKTTMTPYTIDKLIPMMEVTEDTTLQEMVDTEHNLSQYDRLIEFIDENIKWETLPTASEEWRYIAKYNWNGFFDRIFEMGTAGENYIEDSIDENNNTIVLYNTESEENFMVHHIINMQYFAPMKPMEESFNTFDEEHQPKAAITKQ